MHPPTENKHGCRMGTSTAGYIATDDLPPQGTDATQVDIPNPPGVVMQDVPEATSMGREAPSIALDKYTHNVSF